MNMPLRTLLSTGVAAAALAAAWTASAAPVLATGSPPQVNAGGTLPTISTGTTTTVDLNAPRTIIDWTSFNVASGEAVNFSFDRRGWIALNRVAGGPINIDGAVTGAGNVWFSSPGGVIFGPHAQVDVAGLLAVSASFTPAEFLDTSSLTFNLSGVGGGPVSVKSGARINTDGSLALIAPFVETEAGAQVTSKGDLMYGAADSYRLRFVGGDDSDFSLFDFIIPSASAGTPNTLALSLAGVSRGGDVNLFAVSRASVASLLINAPGLIVANRGDVGEVQIATGSSMIERQPFVGGNNTVPTEVIGATTGSARAGDINARTYAEVILYGATDLGAFQANNVVSGATTFFTARDIILNTVDAGRNPDPFNPTNINVGFDAYGKVVASSITAVGQVNINPGPRSTARTTARANMDLGTLTAGQNATLGGSTVNVGTANVTGALAIAGTGAPSSSIGVGTARASSIFMFATNAVLADTVTATGAVAGTNPFSASVFSGDLQVSSNGATTVRTAIAAANAGFSSGGAGLPAATIDVGSVSASSVGLNTSGSITVGNLTTTGAVARSNTILGGLTGLNAVAASGLSAVSGGPISIITTNTAGRARITTNGDINVGTVRAPGADIGAAGNLTVGTATISGDYLIGARGKASVGIIDGGASSTLGVGAGLTIGTRVTAPNLTLLRGQVVGGSGVGGLSNADFQKLRVPGRVEIYGGEPANTFVPTDPGGDINIGDLDVDASRIGQLAILAAGNRSINVTGALRYTGATPLMFGDARPEWQADFVNITGSVTAPNIAFTVNDVDGFGRLTSTGTLSFLNPDTEVQLSTVTANVITATTDLNLTLDNLDLTGSLTAAGNLVLAAHRGDVTIGGTTGDLITNAEFGRIRAAEIDIFAGADISPTVQPRGNMTVLDLDVDPAKVPRLGLYGQGDHSITIAGALRPTTSGGVLQIGAVAVRDSDVGDLRTARIIVTGSIGSANGTPERGYTDVRAFKSVELNALDNVLFGSTSFVDLVGRTAPDQIDIGHGKPAGVEPAPADVGKIWLAAGSLTASAKQRIVSQNTGQPGLQNGLYITGDGVAATDPVLRANGAAVVDLYGAFQGDKGLVSGFSATFSSRLVAEGSTVVRFNGCAVGLGCQVSTPAAEFRIEQVDAVVADSSAATGAAVVVDPPLFTSPPKVADDDREQDVVVTGAGNEEIWRRKP